MCGIVGILSSTVLTRTQDEQFSKLLIMDQVRGYDSCGIIAEKFKGTDFIKSVYDPATFLSDKKTQSVMTGARALVGHNRAATRGSIRTQNAHPFNHGAVTLVHNGTLTYPQLPSQNLFDVDSEAIAYNLSVTEPDAAAAFLETISGAYALVWRDDRDDSWNLARNEERPLMVMPLVGGTSLYLSSEAGILYAAVNKEVQVDPATQIVPLPVGEQWKITTVNGKLHKEVIKFTPKKSYSYTAPKAGSVGSWVTTNLPSTTSNTGGKKVTESYSDAEKAFVKAFAGKLTPGWQSVTIDREYEGRNGNRCYIGYLDKDPGNEVRITCTEQLDYVQSYECWISSLWMESFGNSKSSTVYDYILTSGSIRVSKKEKPTEEKDAPIQCINCGGVFTANEMYHLEDGDSLCSTCYTTDDNESKMYAHSVGIKTRPVKE